MIRLIILSICLTLKVGFSYSQSTNYQEVEAGNFAATKYTSYSSKSKTSYQIGDQIQLGKPSGENEMFVFIQKMDITAKPVQFGNEDAGKSVTIQSIKISGDGEGGNQVGFLAQGDNTKDYYIIFIDSAEQSGEIK